MPTCSIRAGDTLSAIARRFHTTVSALATSNSIRDPNLVRVGARLKVPGSRFEPPAPQVTARAAVKTTTTSTAPVPAKARLAVIGDSHTAGAFGSALQARLTTYLRAGAGKLSSFTGIPSASVSQYLDGGTTQAGAQTFQVPTLASILAKRPRVLMVALGTNMLFNSSAANKAQIRALLAKADAAGTKVVWVGPPNVHGFSGNLAGGAPEARFYAELRAVNAERTAQGRHPMTIIDSRKSTSEGQTLDGVHFGGAQARTWARQVFADAT